MTESFRFLTVDDVLLLHKQGVEEHGGSTGVRDVGLLESAVAAPMNVALYEGADLAAVATAYLFALCRNHAFVDGNKRVALRAADVFLYINGVELNLGADAAYSITLRVAKGECSREELTQLIRSHLRPL